MCVKIKLVLQFSFSKGRTFKARRHKKLEDYYCHHLEVTRNCTILNADTVRLWPGVMSNVWIGLVEIL